jgi:ABC-type uncharacterized transport system permease subunit
LTAAILFHLGLAAYAVAAVGYVGWLFRPAAPPARVGLIATGIGFGLHSLAVGFRAVALVSDESARFGFGEGLSALGFLVVAGFLFSGKRHRLPVIGAFVTPLVLALMIPAHLVPAIAGRVRVVGVILPFHIAVALAGVAAFALGFGVAVMYLLLERQLKAKKTGALFRRLPSLRLLDTLNQKLVVLGFALLSLTIVTGAFFSHLESGPLLALEPKQSFALLAWALVAVVLLLRQTTGWSGRRVALATMASFGLMVFAYLGVFAGGAA